MDRQEAIIAMREGKKVTHDRFTSTEWMTMEGRLFLTEDGYYHEPSEFWIYRPDGFEDGWSLFKQQATEGS